MTEKSENVVPEERSAALPQASAPGLPAVVEYIAESIPQAGPGPVGQLWLGTAEFLRPEIARQHLPQALLALLCMISPHVGRPVSLFIAKDPEADPERFLEVTRSIIPHDLQVEFARLARKTLQQQPSLLQGKTVIAYDINALKGGRDLVRSLLSRGMARDVSTLREEGFLLVQEIHVTGPTSVVALIDLPEPDWSRTLPGLRDRLEADTQFLEEELSRRSWRTGPNPEQEIRAQFLAREFQRLQPVPVAIPFLKQITVGLGVTTPQVLQKQEYIRKLIEVITIINRHGFASGEEIWRGYYGMNDLRNARMKPSPASPRLLPGGGIVPPSSGLFTATKVEYHIFHQIAVRLFGWDESRLPRDQERVVNAIKRLNEHFLFRTGLFISRDARDQELIATLEAQTDLRGWATVHGILEVMREDGGSSVSKSTIDRALGELLKRRLVVKKKDPRVSNGFRYRVDSFTEGSRPDLPQPQEIDDPVCQGKPVQIINLLTGEEETI